MDEYVMSYELFVTKIIDELSVARTAQLVRALVNKYKILNTEDAVNMIRKCQRDNILLTSVDGWTVKRKAYGMLTGDFNFSKLDFGGKDRIPYALGEYVKDVNKPVIDCFWIISSLMPISEYFMLHNNPWHICFSTSRHNKEDDSYDSAYYKIVKLDGIGTNNDVIPAVAMLNEAIKLEDKRFINITHHIAVIENFSSASYIPKDMFDFVCLINENAEEGYVMVDDAKVGTYYEDDE